MCRTETFGNYGTIKHVSKLSRQDANGRNPRLSNEDKSCEQVSWMRLVCPMKKPNQYWKNGKTQVATARERWTTLLHFYTLHCARWSIRAEGHSHDNVWWDEQNVMNYRSYDHNIFTIGKRNAKLGMKTQFYSKRDKMEPWSSSSAATFWTPILSPDRKQRRKMPKRSIDGKWNIYGSRRYRKIVSKVIHSHPTAQLEKQY